MPRNYMPLGAAENVENWIFDEHSAAVIEKIMQTSALEQLGRSEPMGAAVKTVNRDGGFTVGSVAKGGTYGLSTSDNDTVELTARKLGGAQQINDEDLQDPSVDVLAVKRRGAARSLAIYTDNSAFGTSAAENFVGGVNFTSVYRAVRTNGDATSVESSYVADDNYTSVTAANFVAAYAAGTGFDKLNDWLAKYEESDYFDEENTFVVASPAFRKYLRGVKDADGNPLLIPRVVGSSLNDRPRYDVLGYNTVWSKGARTSAVSTQNPQGRPLLIIGNREMLIRGDAKLAPHIPAGQPGFALQRSAVGSGFLTDTSYMKAAIRRGFRVGTRLAFSVLEVTA